jgi:hypothetical protein
MARRFDDKKSRPPDLTVVDSPVPIRETEEHRRDVQPQLQDTDLHYADYGLIAIELNVKTGGIIFPPRHGVVLRPPRNEVSGPQFVVLTEAFQGPRIQYENFRNVIIGEHSKLFPKQILLRLMKKYDTHWLLCALQLDVLRSYRGDELFRILREPATRDLAREVLRALIQDLENGAQNPVQQLASQGELPFSILVGVLDSFAYNKRSQRVTRQPRLTHTDDRIGTDGDSRKGQELSVELNVRTGSVIYPPRRVPLYPFMQRHYEVVQKFANTGFATRTLAWCEALRGYDTEWVSVTIQMQDILQLAKKRRNVGRGPEAHFGDVLTRLLGMTQRDVLTSIVVERMIHERPFYSFGVAVLDSFSPHPSQPVLTQAGEKTVLEHDTCDIVDGDDSQLEKEPNRDVDAETEALEEELLARVNLIKARLPRVPSASDTAGNAKKVIATIRTAVASHEEFTASEIAAKHRAHDAVKRTVMKELTAVLKPLYDNEDLSDWSDQDRRELVEHINDTCRLCGMRIGVLRAGPWGSLGLKSGRYFQIKYTHPDGGVTTSEYLGTRLPPLVFRVKK